MRTPEGRQKMLMLQGFLRSLMVRLAACEAATAGDGCTAIACGVAVSGGQQEYAAIICAAAVANFRFLAD